LARISGSERFLYLKIKLKIINNNIETGISMTKYFNSTFIIIKPF